MTSQPDYSELRASLEEELSVLIARAEEIDKNLSDPASEDWEDRASENEGDEVAESIGNLALKEIDQIKHALHRIEVGTYGTCARCGKRIPKARLTAIPYSTTCTKCA